MGNKIFPTREDDYIIYVKAAVLHLTTAANATRLGISTARQTTLNNKLNAYATAYGKASVLSTRTRNDISDRNTARATLTDELRDVYSGLTESLLTDTDRNTLNLQRRSASTPAAIPATQPDGRVDTAIRLQHTLHFWDTNTPNSRARPAGVRGCEIWYVVGPASAPADVKQYRFLALDSETPYIATFDGADAGKPVWYIMRWVNTRGQAGPWSAPIMATITG